METGYQRLFGDNVYGSTNVLSQAFSLPGCGAFSAWDECPKLCYSRLPAFRIGQQAGPDKEHGAVGEQHLVF
jgi:hypothetical protein